MLDQKGERACGPSESNDLVNSKLGSYLFICSSDKEQKLIRSGVNCSLSSRKEQKLMRSSVNTNQRRVNSTKLLN